MGNFVTGVAADHTDCAEAMRDREEANHTVRLVKSMIAISFQRTRVCRVNEGMLEQRKRMYADVAA